MTPDIHTLTGAYAVDALDDDERRMFEAHLRECDACAREVDEFQETATRLGMAMYEAPPTHLKGDILTAIDDVRQETPITPMRPSRDTFMRRVALPAAAAVAAFALGLGAASLTTDDSGAELAAVMDVLSAEDVDIVSASSDGITGRAVVSPSTGEAVFIAEGFAAAPDGQVYELWLLTADRAVPAGLFDSENGRVSHVMKGDMSDVVAIGVTLEPEGGSQQPTSDPLLVIELDA